MYVHVSMYGMSTCMCVCGVHELVCACMHMYVCVWYACMCVYLFGVDACVHAHVHVSGVNVCVCISVEGRGSYRQGVSSIAHDHISGTGSLTDLVSLTGLLFPESLSGSPVLGSWIHTRVYAQLYLWILQIQANIFKHT